MLKRALPVLIRVAIGLFIAWLIVYFLIVLPRQQAHDTIVKNTGLARDVNRTLNDSYTRIRALQSPQVIQLRTKDSAKKYVAALTQIVPTFNLPHVDMPKEVQTAWPNKYVVTYNSLVNDTSFLKAYSGSITAVKSAGDFVLCHRDIMFALTNLLEYDAAADTANLQPDTLKDHLDAAAAGVQNTLDRINKSPKLKSDTTLGEITEQINKIEAARQAYRLGFGGASAEQLRANYIAAVTSAQQAILANRVSFWNATQTQMLKSITDNITAMRSEFRTNLEFLSGYVQFAQ